MQILSDIAELRGALRSRRSDRSDDRLTLPSVGFVPTLGALHAGHRSLVRAARQQCDIVVVSIFVNPTQFGPNEDFSRYPRTLQQDCQMLEAEGVDLVFTPTAEAMYPPGASTFVEVEEVSDRLDGASRPGHFRGVATVVAKLFHIVQPEFSFFGQKDAAQVAVLRKMVRELDFPLEIIVCPTVREPDGLAMSSRNRYLSEEERRQALTLSRSLQAAAMQAETGEHRASALQQTMQATLQQEPAIRMDYIAIVDPNTLLPVEDVGAGALLAVAAHVGNTRLIDNVLLAAAAGNTGVVSEKKS
jgi:pantoate--beta-alanine ligase